MVTDFTLQQTERFKLVFLSLSFCHISAPKQNIFYSQRNNKSSPWFLYKVEKINPALTGSCCGVPLCFSDRHQQASGRRWWDDMAASDGGGEWGGGLRPCRTPQRWSDGKWKEELDEAGGRREGLSIIHQAGGGRESSAPRRWWWWVGFRD